MQHRVALLPLSLTRAVRHLSLLQRRASASALPCETAPMRSLQHSHAWWRTHGNLPTSSQGFAHNAWLDASWTLRQPCRRLSRSLQPLQCASEGSSSGTNPSDAVRRADDGVQQPPQPLSPASLAPAATREVQQVRSVDGSSLAGCASACAPSVTDVRCYTCHARSCHESCWRQKLCSVLTCCILSGRLDFGGYGRTRAEKVLLEQLLGMQGTQAAGLDGIISRVRGLAAWQHSLQVMSEHRDQLLSNCSFCTQADHLAAWSGGG